MASLSGWRPFGQGSAQLPDQCTELQSRSSMCWPWARLGAGSPRSTTSRAISSRRPVLQFGLANNNSQPDASYLTDGTNLDGTYVRPPAQQVRHRHADDRGRGELHRRHDDLRRRPRCSATAAPAAARSLGNVAFCSDATNPLCDTSIKQGARLQSGRTATRSAASISGPGQVYPDRRPAPPILSGASTYTGPTFVEAGHARGQRLAHVAGDGQQRAARSPAPARWQTSVSIAAGRSHPARSGRPARS